MMQCHWCKGFFPDDQVSSIEQYTLDGRMQNVHYACDSCLKAVFPPAKLSEDKKGSSQGRPKSTKKQLK